MKPGDIIGNYRLRQPLGAGSMGEVWLATQLQLDRPVALKMMSPETAVDGTAVHRFRREMKLHASLAHPNLVTVYDGGTHGDSLYLVMEFLPHGSLRTLMTAPQPIGIAEGIAMLAGIAGAVAHLHERTILHRDLKPENILLEASGVPKVTDFGLSRSSKHTVLTHEGHAVGTPLYVPPEVLEGDPPTAAGDVYAVGIVAYQLFSRGVPFSARSVPELIRQIVKGERTPLAESAPQLRPDIVQLVEDCLDRDPARRPTAAELEQRASELPRRHTGLTPGPGRITRSGMTSITSTPAGSPRRAHAVTFLTLGLALAAGAAWLRQQPPDAAPESPSAAAAPESPVASAAPEAGSLEALLAAKRERLRPVRPVVHLMPAGEPRGSTHRIVEHCVRLDAGPAFRGTMRPGAFLLLPWTGTGAAVLRAREPGSEALEIQVNGHAIPRGPDGTWPLPADHLRPGLNGLRVIGGSPEDSSPRFELSPPGPVDLDGAGPGTPGMSPEMLARMPEIGSRRSILDHEALLRNALDVQRDFPTHPRLRIYVAELRMRVVAPRMHFRSADTVLLASQELGVGSSPVGPETPDEEHLARAMIEISSVLAAYPRDTAGWITLARCLGLAGLESECWNAARFSVIPAPMDGWPWACFVALVDDMILRGKARPDRIAEAIEAGRLARKLDRNLDLGRELESLQKRLTGGTRRPDGK